MLYVIGLGLADEQDITLRGLQVISTLPTDPAAQLSARPSRALLVYTWRPTRAS